MTNLTECNVRNESIRTFAEEVREERAHAGDEAELVQILHLVLMRRLEERIDDIGGDQDAAAVGRRCASQ